MTKAGIQRIAAATQNEQDEDLALKAALLKTLDQHSRSWKRLPDEQAILVERQGETVAVLLTPQHFERIVEELENLRDAIHAREILEAIRNGEEKTISLAQVEAELRAEGILDE